MDLVISLVVLDFIFLIPRGCRMLHVFMSAGYVLKFFQKNARVKNVRYNEILSHLLICTPY